MKYIFNGYAFDNSKSPPVYCQHAIVKMDDGTLEHSTDGKLRAQVERDGAVAYLAGPSLASVAEKLDGKQRAAIAAYQKAEADRQEKEQYP